MRAIGLTEFGPPAVLRELDVPEPHAGPGEVRIRVRAAAVNPTDTLLRSGALAGNREDDGPPCVPGMDAAGVVDELGDGLIDRFAVGDPVVALVTPWGTRGAYAEHVVVPAAAVARAPAGVGAVAGATLPLNALTALHALTVLDPPAGSTVGVTGAAGAVGGYVVELARARGLRVVADAAPADADAVRALGADEVVARGPGVAAAMREVAPDGVDVLVDCAVQGDEVLPAVRDGGRIGNVRWHENATERGITWHSVIAPFMVRDPDALDRLCRDVESGALGLRVADVLPAGRAADAHSRLERGGVRGRLVLEL